MDRALRISRIAMAASLILAVTLSLGCAMLLSLILNRSEQLAQQQVPVSPPSAPPLPAENRLETSWRMFAEDASRPGPWAFSAG